MEHMKNAYNQAFILVNHTKNRLCILFIIFKNYLAFFINYLKKM